MPDAGYRLLVLIARNEDAFDPLITGLLDVGITGATVIESRGIGAVIREDMPFFAGLAALLPQHTGSRMLVSVTTPDRIEGLLKELLPTIEVTRQPRFSRLTYAGSRRLTSLPPRSAIVAFSMRHVYEIAERVRHKHGGAAVVLGALSPQTRNAQVALYESGEVQHLVATDAIGMGLNMDIHHVALAGLHKFDGHTYRALEDHELAQIAGRAGRYRRDGTFGTTHGVDPLDPDVVGAIEGHSFLPLRRIHWRNRELDFSSAEALLASLTVRPRHRVLRAAERADDVRALTVLVEEAEVAPTLASSDRLRLLWEVCGVPDFGNLLPEHHATLLAQV